MLTLIPPTWGVSKKPDGHNGRNWPFAAYYWTGHPYAAAIAAQEVREARYKAVRMLPGLALGIALLAFLPPLHAALGALILACLSAAVLVSKKDVELRGQSVECIVRNQAYGTPIDVALDEAAAQLTRYKQFKGMSLAAIRDDLEDELHDADKWADKNHKLIERALP